MPISVADRAANAPELIQQAAELLSKSKQRRAVFVAIYTGKRRSKTVDELVKVTGLPTRNRVLDLGKQLAASGIVHQIKVGHQTAYEKIDFYQHNRSKILSLSENSTKREQYPTKRNPKLTGTLVKLTATVKRKDVQARFITVDDIDSFSKVKKVKRQPDFIKIPEKQFKLGVAKILGEESDFKDWGGELSDLYSSNVLIGGKRHLIAFAFKGPGKAGTLVPGKLGKNGDQIQRLFRCNADVFFVQYWRDIDQSVLEQMRQFAELTSYYHNKEIWYGIIDGYDSVRLMLAYPELFVK